ncbi:MAG: hypothetical protein WEC84_04715 [Candidatus Andersenbacteria bacterium]
MKTLLEKVQKIETEATKLVESAETAAKKELEQIQGSEDTVVEDLRTKAERKARAIVGEHVQSAQEEINKIKQEQAHSVEMVHSAAERTRKDALKKAHQLFEDEYLK